MTTEFDTSEIPVIGDLSTQTNVLTIVGPGNATCGTFDFDRSYFFGVIDEKPLKATENVTLIPGVKYLAHANARCRVQVFTNEKSAVSPPPIPDSVKESYTPTPTKSLTNPKASAKPKASPGAGAPTKPGGTPAVSPSAAPNIAAVPVEPNGNTTITGDPDDAIQSSPFESEGASTSDSSVSNPSSSDGANASSNGGECFTADSEVQLKDGRIVRMEDLEVGDVVLVRKNEFSKVFLFTHRDAIHYGEFIKLTTNVGTHLTLTAGHYIYRNGNLAAARSVEVGDSLLAASSDGTRTKLVVEIVENIEGRGLYNPQTQHGDIVVNGIVASTFSDAVNPTVAKILLSPIRRLFDAGFISRKIANVLTHCIEMINRQGSYWLF